MPRAIRSCSSMTGPGVDVDERSERATCSGSGSSVCYPAQSSLERANALAYETSQPLPLENSENNSQAIDNVMTSDGITAPDGPITFKPPAINIVYTI